MVSWTLRNFTTRTRSEFHDTRLADRKLVISAAQITEDADRDVLHMVDAMRCIPYPFDHAVDAKHVDERFDHHPYGYELRGAD
jgi:hypothetical protein